MKGNQKQFIRKIVSVVLAVAMVATGISYTPQSVNAADTETITLNDRTYTVSQQNSSIVGYVQATADTANEDNARFVFQWNPEQGPQTVTAVIKQDGTEITRLENQSNGFGIYIKDIAGYAEGNYTIEITDDAGSSQTAQVSLTITGTQKETESGTGTETAPDYSDITVAEDGWELLGTGADGSEWYIGTELFTALGGSGFKVIKGEGENVEWIDNTLSTVTGAKLAFGIPNQDQFASVWVNDQKIPIGENFYKPSADPAPDVIVLSQSLFEAGKTSYVTVRYADGTDKIFPVKLEKAVIPDFELTDISIVEEAPYTPGQQVHVKITVKNSGEADIVNIGTGSYNADIVDESIYTGKMVSDIYTNLFVRVKGDTNNETEVGWGGLPITDSKLSVNEETSIIYSYTIPDDADTVSYELVAVADNNKIYEAEGNASRNNNTSAIDLVVGEIVTTPEVTLTNTEGTISASADTVEGVANYNLTYVADGTTVTIPADELTVAEGKVTYTFPENVVLDNNTDVNLVNADTGAILVTGKALADLVVTAIEPDGPIIVGEKTTFTVTVENKGVAKATTDADAAVSGKITYTYFINNEWKNWTEKDDGLEPNQSVQVTFDYTPTEKGPFTFTAGVDDRYDVTESDDGIDNQNKYTTSFNATSAGTLNVANVDGTITATWAKNPEADEPLGYVLTYYSNGVQKEIETDAATTTAVITDTIDYQSKVTIAARYANGTPVFAQQTALPDLKIKSVALSGGVNEEQTEIYRGRMFSATVTFENVGITEVPASSNYVDPDTGEIPDYGKWIMVSLEGTNIASYDDAGKTQFVSEGVYQGVAVNGERTVTFERLVSSEVSDATSLTVKVDAPSFTGTEAEGFIPELYEDNNSKTVALKTVKPIASKEMDWTMFTAAAENTDEDGNPFVIVNNGSDRRGVEYKVLDTSITDLDYADIMTKVEAYGGQYIGFGIDNESPIVKSSTEGITTKMYFSQVSSSTAENYTSSLDSSINYVERSVGDGVLQTWDGNGYQLHTRSFAAGKYYIIKIVNEDDGSYLTLGLRIPGDLGTWVKAKASDNSDPDKVPVVYHDKDHGINGTIYYDGSDLGLAGISIYNGNHLSLTTDGTKTLNLTDGDNWRMTIAYASVDENGVFREQIDGDTLAHIGSDPGTIELPPTAEIYGTQGANTILIKLPELMQDLPIHSSLGGQRDEEYYILKVYYDTVNNPDDYISVPLRIIGDIPEIENVNGLTAGKRGDALTVSWTNSITQELDSYLYDVMIYTCDKDGTNEKLIKTVEGVTAGSYTYENLVADMDTTSFKVKVVAHWCEQTTDAEDAVAMVISDLPDPLPGEEPGTREDKWVLIDGQYYLPINDGNGGTTMAEVWYYTDENMSAVIGYNDRYIALNGNEQYFVGSNTQLFVQNDDEENRQFVAKSIYDSVYKGQIQMDAVKMFSVYNEEPADDGFYYYTVKVRDGENVDTSYNFYFRVKVTDEPVQKDTDEAWKLIKGTSTLPVKFSYTDTQEVEDINGNIITETVNKIIDVNGVIEYYDAPDKTSTYAVTGYNDYYMSLIGDTSVYAGTNKETNEVSIDIVNTGTEDNSSLITAEPDGTIPAAELTGYSPSSIYDSLYPGETQINASNVFAVTNPVSYYMLRITGTAEDGTETTTYLPIRITVQTGNVRLEGYQMNTNTAEGAVSEFNPSFRVMSSADQIITGSDGRLHGVKKFGTIYGLKNRVGSAEDMVVDSSNANVHTYEATGLGIYETGLFSQSNIKEEEEERTYWALTFKHLNYSYDAIVTNYVFRAYAILDNGEVVYDDNSYGFDETQVNVYNIATSLYEGKKMGSASAHEFLFDNVISIVDIHNNIYGIGMALLNTAGEDNYSTVNNVYHDLFDYVRGQEAYSDENQYQLRQTTGFVAKREAGSETTLLGVLNTKSGTNYSNLIDWIAGETTGLIHEKVEFSKNLMP